MAERQDREIRQVESHEAMDREYQAWVDSLTPGQRFEMVFEATRRAVAMQGENWDDRRLRRDIVRVIRDGHA